MTDIKNCTCPKCPDVDSLEVAECWTCTDCEKIWEVGKFFFNRRGISRG